MSENTTPEGSAETPETTLQDLEPVLDVPKEVVEQIGGGRAKAALRSSCDANPNADWDWNE